MTIPEWVLTIAWGALAGSLGFAAGASEVMSRYRDEPMRALWNRFGLFYAAANGVVSILAFLLLLRYPDKVVPAIANDSLLTAVAAGFGAMVLLRSHLFVIRTDDGKEYPVGPSLAVDTFLRTIDRQIDRLRATQRQNKVHSHMKDVQDFEGAAGYLKVSLLSFQNLSEDEKRDIAGIIDEYRALKDVPASLKTMAVGFAFLTIAGEENFDQVIGSMKAYLPPSSSKGGGEAVRGEPIAGAGG